MNTPSESEALLLIADISGYTRFMLTNRTARVHAHGIVSDLLTAVVGRAEPPLMVNKFEGDAVLMLAPRQDSGWHEAGRDLGARLTGFVDAFNEKLAELAASNICGCIACQQMVKLRLKVLAHYGVAVRSRIAGFDEVSGVDVIVIHRLLKNEERAAEYVLLTEPAYDFLAPPGEYVTARESYDDVGEIPVRIRALATAVPAAARRGFSLVDAWRKLGYDLTYVAAGWKHRVRAPGHFVVPHDRRG